MPNQFYFRLEHGVVKQNMFNPLQIIKKTTKVKIPIPSFQEKTIDSYKSRNQ